MFKRIGAQCAVSVLALVMAPAVFAGEVKSDGVYTLKTCPVSGGELGSMGEPVVKNYDGREVRFCCGGCAPKYEADPAKFNAKIDEAIAEQQRNDYALATCPICGKELGENAVEFVHNNRLVKTCSQECVAKVKENWDETLSKLNAAVCEKQSASYDKTTCPVSGEALGDEPVNYVLGSKLVKLCCGGCAKKVAANPAKTLMFLGGEEAKADAPATAEEKPKAGKTGRKEE